MIEATHTRPFAATAVCSGPVVERLDVDRIVSSSGNRWSADGEPTLYLAGDAGIALAEVGRHWSPDDGPSRLWQVRVDLAAAIDLRDEATRTAVGVPTDPGWFLDRERCQEVGSRLRGLPRCDGLIVPSVAFLDDRSRWNAVVFIDRLTVPLGQAVRPLQPTHELIPLGD
jgi:RES domain-containing protein